MRLAIVGSTNLNTSQTDTAYWLVEMIVNQYNLGSSTFLEIVSGGANGIDHIAEWTADDFKSVGVGKKIFLPDIEQWESEYTWDLGSGSDCIPYKKELRGFKSRNLQIAEYCDELVCIRSDQSRTYGSGWTADRAEEMGKDVRRLKLP